MRKSEEGTESTSGKVALTERKGGEVGKQTKVGNAISAEKKTRLVARSESSRKGKQPVDRLRELGYEISGDQVRSRTAKYNVLVKTPEGMEIACSNLEISDDDKWLTLVGGVALKGNNGNLEDGSYKIDVADSAHSLGTIKISLVDGDMVMEGNSMTLSGLEVSGVDVSE